MSQRPNFIRNISECVGQRESYPGDEELLSEGIPLARLLGLSRLGIHHERLAPGARTSWPHAEKMNEEFVYVLSGTPDVWIDGQLYRLTPGDAVAFVPGTGIAHTFLNQTADDVCLLVIGENHQANAVYYPLKPAGYAGMLDARRWTPDPAPQLGPHPGLPLAVRSKA